MLAWCGDVSSRFRRVCVKFGEEERGNRLLGPGQGQFFLRKRVERPGRGCLKTNLEEEKEN